MKASFKQLQLTGANYRNDRRELDFYPTPENVTVALMDFINLDQCVIWEPACGIGSMSKVLKRYGHTVISTDINKTDYAEHCVDYLKENSIKADAIITNPPFNLASEFIEKALKDARVVCMLLKSQYWHAKARYHLFQSSKPAFVLPLTWRPDFLFHERRRGETGSPTMEMCWTVWKRGSTITQYVPLLKPTTQTELFI